LQSHEGLTVPSQHIACAPEQPQTPL